MTQILWPNQTLDVLFCPKPPPYSDLSHLLFAMGWTGKILAELLHKLNGSIMVNQLRHLNRILHYGIDSEWSSFLSFNHAFLKSIEQEQSSWESWEAIETCHDRHVNAMKITGRKKKPSPGGGDGSVSGSSRAPVQRNCRTRCQTGSSSPTCVPSVEAQTASVPQPSLSDLPAQKGFFGQRSCQRVPTSN